jgi:hypothetical protein
LKLFDGVLENEDNREFALSVGDDDRIKPRAIKLFFKLT